MQGVRLLWKTFNFKLNIPTLILTPNVLPIHFFGSIKLFNPNNLNETNYHLHLTKATMRWTIPLRTMPGLKGRWKTLTTVRISYWTSATQSVPMQAFLTNCKSLQEIFKQWNSGLSIRVQLNQTADLKAPASASRFISAALPSPLKYCVTLWPKHTANDLKHRNRKTTVC